MMERQTTRKPTNPRSAVVYLRVSSDDQRERETIKTQEDAIQRFLINHPEYDVITWYRDDGVSGTESLGQRPAGRQLIADATAGRFEVVIVTRADRLGRDAVDLMKVWALFDTLDIELVGAVEPLDDELGFDLRAVWAKHERKRFLQRSSEGLERAAREGRYCGGIVPYGFRVEGEKPHARLAPDEGIVWCDRSASDIVRWMYDLVGREGWSCVQVAEHFNQLRVPTHYQRDDRRMGGKSRGYRKQRTQGIWRSSRIRNMLVEPIYRGQYAYGRRSQKRREPIVVACPALVSEELWVAAQATLAGHRIFPKAGVKRHYILRSFIRCGNCGLHYCGSWHPGGGKVWYRCNGRIAGRGPLSNRCQGKSIDGDLLEPLVLDDITRFLRDPGPILDELASELTAEAEGVVPGKAEREALLFRLDGLQQEHERIVKSLRRGLIEEEDYMREMAEIKAERANVERLLTELGPEPASCPPREVVADELLVELRRRIDGGLSQEQLFAVVSSLVRRITASTETGDDGKPRLRISIEYAFALAAGSVAICGAVNHTGTRVVQDSTRFATRVLVLG